MSYDVYIHRAEDHFEVAENPIRREEWEAWVANAPDFDFDEANFVTSVMTTVSGRSIWRSGRPILKVRSGAPLLRGDRHDG